MPSPNAEPLMLSAEERAMLREWASAEGRAAALAQRASIVLRCADGETIGQVAAALGVSRDTVSKWRRRFAVLRLAGLADDPRPGRPRLITDTQVAEVIAKTLSREPTDGERWSTRSLAVATGMSQSAISRIWRAYDRPPHVIHTWALSTQSHLTDLVCDIAGLFVSPPHDMLALAAVNEGTVREPIGPSPRRRAARRVRIAYEPIRCGTRGLVAALDEPRQPPTEDGRQAATGRQCVRFLKALDHALTAEFTPHLVCADSATYKLPAVKNWLLRHPRFQLHATPTRSSWFAVVERWLAEFASRLPYPVTPRDMVDLELAVREWLARLAGPDPAFQQISTDDRLRQTLRMHRRWFLGEVWPAGPHRP